MRRSLLPAGTAMLLIALSPMAPEGIAPSLLRAQSAIPLAATASARSSAASTLPVAGSAPVLGLSIDLAAQGAGIAVERPIAIEGRTSVSLALLNALPSARYSVSISVDDVPVGALTLVKDPALGLPAGSAVHVLYGRLLRELDSAADELDVGRTAQQTRRDVQRAYEDGGGFMLDSVDARTAYRLESVASIRPGERMRVTVVRHAPDGSESARWSTTYSTSAPGEWQIGLGFAFPWIVGAFERYSIRRGDDGAWRVRASAGDDRLSLVPALFFTWVARDSRLDAWTMSLSGGVGFDLQSPVVLLGGALSFHRNITITAGIAAHQVPRLDPEYAVGDVVDERLRSEDLMSSRYRIDPFVGVGFRLLGTLGLR